MNYILLVQLIVNLFVFAVTIFALTQPVLTFNMSATTNDNINMSTIFELYTNKLCVNISIEGLSFNKCDDTSKMSNNISKELFGLYIMYIILLVLVILSVITNLLKLGVLSAICSVLLFMTSIVLLGYLIIEVKLVELNPSKIATVPNIKSYKTSKNEFSTPTILMITGLCLIILKEAITGRYGLRLLGLRKA
jgi:hypothetical protein